MISTSATTGVLLCLASVLVLATCSPRPLLNNVDPETPLEIAPGDPPQDENAEAGDQTAAKSKQDAYQKIVDMFTATVNATVDPCTDFYEYACGNAKTSTFELTSNTNYEMMAKHMDSPKYRTAETPAALKKTIQFYDSCKKVHTDMKEGIRDDSVVLDAYNEFKTATGLNLAMVSSSEETASSNVLDKTTLAKAVGILSKMDVHTLLTPSVETDWKSSKDHKVYIDQNTCNYTKVFYTPVAWPQIKPTYKNFSLDCFNHFAKLMNINLDQAKLDQDVDDLLEFERLLATNYSTSDVVRQRESRSYNKFTIAQAQSKFEFIDFPTYFASLSGDLEKLSEYFNAPQRDIIVMEPEIIAKLSDDFKANKFDAQLVTNYLFFRVIAKKYGFLPKPHNYATLNKETEGLLANLRSAVSRDKPFSIGGQCAEESLWHMGYANARIFVESQFPNQAFRDGVLESVRKLTENVKASLRKMVTTVGWIDEESKNSALAKLDKLKHDIAYPAFILDDALLNKYYSSLDFTTEDSYFDMRRKLTAFEYHLPYFKLLGEAAVDHTEFFTSPGYPEALYSYTTNAIVVLAGILQAPFYDFNFPASVNYGSFGAMSGHEMAHAFGPYGIQWDASGELSDWMKAESTEGFEKMEQCVEDHYNKYCPLNGTDVSPTCINGKQTMDENVADIAGLHAAWEGYKSDIAGKQPDEPLPGAFSSLTQDQLFFMSFAHTYCQRTPHKYVLYEHILRFSHSPNKYRVLGALHNLPAFKTAFNCPATPEAGPQCSVWF